eukprot:12852425-Ditylum_brightwellii.AAC.1
MINPTRIYRAACQEHLNEALTTVASELHKEDPLYFSNYGTTWEIADYNVQIKSTTAFIMIGEQHRRLRSCLYSVDLCSSLREWTS